MRTILLIFQITTVRSAWMFLVFSAGFLLGVLYLVFTEADFVEGDPFVWVHRGAVAVLSVYVGVAGFALFTEKGRKIVSELERTPRERTVIWYVKAFFACYAVAGAVFIILMPVTMIFGEAGDEFLVEYFYLFWGVAMLAAFPLIYKYLK